MIRLMKNKVNELLMLPGLILRYLDKKQFNPTLDDIENEDLKELANKLKGDSTKETATNILEWQHKNISYWMERGILEIPLLLLTTIFFCVFVDTILSITIYLILLPLLGAAWSISVGLLIFATFLIWIIFQGNMKKLLTILLLFYPVYGLAKLVIINSPSKSATIGTGLTIASLNGVLFGASLFTLIYITLSYLRRFRGHSIKVKFSKLLSIACDSFKFSLPVGKVIDYRLAICRDFAKLTAALFFNYPDSKVYFFTIPSHVATAVKINNEDEYYIFDKRLPVLTKDGWLKKWNVKEANVYSSKLVRNSEDEIVDINFKNHEKVYISDFSGKGDSIVNTSELADKVSKLLGINQISQKDKPDFKIPIKDYADYYEDNDIVKHSLIRGIKNELENELCGNTDKILKIEINQHRNKKDLVISVYL